MSITVNEGGVLYELDTVTVNENGTLYELDTVHSNEGGTLYEIFSAYQLPTSLSWSVASPPYPTQADPNGKIYSTSNNGLTVQYSANHTGTSTGGSNIYCSVWGSDMVLKAGAVITIKPTAIINTNSGASSSGQVVARLVQHSSDSSSEYITIESKTATSTSVSLVFTVEEDGVYNLALTGYAVSSSGPTIGKITVDISFS